MYILLFLLQHERLLPASVKTVSFVRCRSQEMDTHLSSSIENIAQEDVCIR